MVDRGRQINPMVMARDELSFPADGVMPAHFFPASRRRTSVEPILSLMVGILIDGMRCFQRNFEARDAKRRGEFKETEFWIFHDKGNENEPFSFEVVCAA